GRCSWVENGLRGSMYSILPSANVRVCVSRSVEVFALDWASHFPATGSALLFSGSAAWTVAGPASAARFGFNGTGNSVVKSVTTASTPKNTATLVIARLLEKGRHYPLWAPSRRQCHAEWFRFGGLRCAGWCVAAAAEVAQVGHSSVDIRRSLSVQ